MWYWLLAECSLITLTRTKHSPAIVQPITKIFGSFNFIE